MPEWMAEIGLKIRAVFKRRQLDRDLQDEIAFHLAMRESRNREAGLSEPAARIEARRRFGNATSWSETCRDLWTFVSLENIWRDLRYATRVLAASPVFTAVSVMTIALGIGANTAVFSVVDAVLLRPLPYPQANRLAAISIHYQSGDREITDTAIDGRIWELLNDPATVLNGALFSSMTNKVNLAAGQDVNYVVQQRVSARYFEVLGFQPLIGRAFSAVEDRAGGPPVVVLSHAIWQRSFHGDPKVVGSAVRMRGELYNVVGVMPQDFRSLIRADVWTPLRPSKNGEGAGTNYGLAARLKPNATWAQAEAQVARVSHTWIQERHVPADQSIQVRLVALQGGLTGPLREPLFLLWAAAVAVLLIGCVNIAGLLLARGMSRRQEIATRMAIGGGRAALVRQLLAESLLLALCGGAAGLGLGYLGIDALRVMASQSLALTQTIRLDGRVLACTAGLTLATTFLFGLLPSLQTSRMDIRTILLDGARGWAGAKSRWSRRAMVVAEVALGTLLLITAGLLGQTFFYLQELNPGFDSSHVITATMGLQDARYQTAGSVNRLFDESLARIRELPGVEAAAVSLTLPYERGLNTGFRIPGGTSSGTSVLTYITPGYFRALRIPLLRGRAFREGDTQQSVKVAIVNDAFARAYLHGKEAVGSQIVEGREPFEIVGVSGDVQMKRSIGGEAPISAVPVVYIPSAQTSDGMLKMVHTWFTPSWIVRSSSPPSGITAGMRAAVKSVEPQLPFSDFRSLDEIKFQALAQQRFQAILLAVISLLALVLAAVGVYGLIAQSIAERTRELGIRMAVGATLRQALQAVVLPGIALAGAGVAIGAFLAMWSVPLLRRMVWGLSVTDPATFAVVALFLLLVASAAATFPALRILRWNPANILRNE